MDDNRPHTADVADLMAHFDVSRNTVYNWLASDNPPPFLRPGGEYRFNMADVIAWARGVTVTNREPAA